MVNEVIHSGRIRSGPKVLVFEEALNSYLRGTCMVDSFTALGTRDKACRITLIRF